MVIELSGVYFDLLPYELLTKSVDRDSPFCDFVQYFGFWNLVVVAMVTILKFPTGLFKMHF